MFCTEQQQHYHPSRKGKAMYSSDLGLGGRPREGVIINDDKTTLFNELVALKNVILTSQNDVREMEDDDDNNELT